MVIRITNRDFCLFTEYLRNPQDLLDLFWIQIFKIMQFKVQEIPGNPSSCIPVMRPNFLQCRLMQHHMIHNDRECGDRKPDQLGNKLQHRVCCLAVCCCPMIQPPITALHL